MVGMSEEEWDNLSYSEQVKIDKERADREYAKKREKYLEERQPNSEERGEPSKHSAFVSNNGVSNRPLSPQNPVKVIRCTEIARSTGKQCGRWALRGTNVCQKHGGSLPHVKEHAAAVVEAARLRLIGMSDQAIDVIEDLSLNATAEQVRLKASTEILDRAGVRAGVEVDFSGQVDLTVETAADRTRRHLEETARRMAEARRIQEAADEDVVDAEIVEES
jgi:tRNA A37 N6-isopentenylltransferase MiaA